MAQTPKTLSLVFKRSDNHRRKMTTVTEPDRESMHRIAEKIQFDLLEGSVMDDKILHQNSGKMIARAYAYRELPAECIIAIPKPRTPEYNPE